MLSHDSQMDEFGGNSLQCLWGLLMEDFTDPDAFAQNQLRIVAFNYDTSVKRFLINAMNYTYDIPLSHTQEIAGAIPIVHAYGKLPMIDTMRKVEPTEPSPRKVMEAATSLIVLHESVDDSPEFEKAREYVASADVRAFLGFGYLKERPSSEG